MTGSLRWVGAGLCVAGLLLAADALARGAASASLVVIVPVVTGSSLEFFAAVVLIVLGIGVLAGASASGDWDTEEPSVSSPGPAVGSGGVILLGPIPVFFGSWKGSGRRARWAWSAVGAVLLVAVLVIYGFAVGGW